MLLYEITVLGFHQADYTREFKASCPLAQRSNTECARQISWYGANTSRRNAARRMSRQCHDNQRAVKLLNTIKFKYNLVITEHFFVKNY